MNTAHVHLLLGLGMHMRSSSLVQLWVYGREEGEEGEGEGEEGEGEGEEGEGRRALHPAVSNVG